MTETRIHAGGNVADPENWNTLNDTLAQFPTVVENIVTKAVKQQSAPIYQTRMLNLPPGQPVLLLDYNPNRVRFFVSASATGVIIGERSVLNADGLDGFVLPPAAIEMRTVAPVYVTATGEEAVLVSLWAEYSAE